MKLNLYTAFDTISNSSLCVFTSANDGTAIRENLPSLSRVVPVKDLRFYQVGWFDSETLEVQHLPDGRREFQIDAYKFPETPVQNVAAGKSQDEARADFERRNADLLK